MNANKPLPSTTAGALWSAVSAAIAYMAGLNWDFNAIDWSLALNWLIALVTAGGVVGYTTSDKTQPKTNSPITPDEELDLSVPLGLRINNPGNLRPDGSKWQGMTGVYKGFVKFDKPENGLRAMARNLRNQKRLHGKETIEQIITKYAPDNENNTLAYIGYVAKQMNKQPTEFIDLEQDNILASMMVPMIRMENGKQPFSTELILDAVKLA